MRHKKSLLRYFIPLVMLTILLVLIGNELRTSQDPFAVADGSRVPHFELQDLWQPDNRFTEKALPQGQAVLLHVWGSWCSACQQEHPLLMDIMHRYHILIYSLDYKDNPDAAKAWLTQHGNPYVQTGIDPRGNLSRHLGVYGTPETFLVDKHGIIRYRHIGIIDKTAWDKEIFPLITQYRQAD